MSLRWWRNPCRVVFGSGKCLMSAGDFLAAYKNDINLLPVSNDAAFFQSLKGRDKQILTTLLPAAAAIKRRYPELKAAELIERTKVYCVCVIDKVLNCGLY